MTKPWSEAIRDIPKSGPDHRWAGPTAKCLCGNRLLAAVVTFADRQISTYMTDVLCCQCGATLTAPTEIDEEPRNA